MPVARCGVVPGAGNGGSALASAWVVGLAPYDKGAVSHQELFPTRPKLKHQYEREACHCIQP